MHERPKGNGVMKDGGVTYSRFESALMAGVVRATGDIAHARKALTGLVEPVPSNDFLKNVAKEWGVINPKPLKTATSLVKRGDFFTPDRVKKVVHFFRAIQQQQGNGPNRWSGEKERRVLAGLVRRLNVVGTREFLKEHKIVPPSAPTLAKIAKEAGIHLSQGRPRAA